MQPAHEFIHIYKIPKHVEAHTDSKPYRQTIHSLQKKKKVHHLPLPWKNIMSHLHKPKKMTNGTCKAKNPFAKCNLRSRATDLFLA